VSQARRLLLLTPIDQCENNTLENGPSSKKALEDAQQRQWGGCTRISDGAKSAGEGGDPWGK